MNWLGDSFPVAMNRLPLILAVVFFALYVVMLWLLLFRRPSFRTLSGRDRWSVVTATFGVMAVWMLLSCLLIRAVPFFGGRRGLRLAFPIAVMSLMIWTIVTTWPVAVWTAFRIALRRLAKKERRILISWLSVRVSAAFLLAFSLVWLVFHFVFAGRHSFDHITEFGPRNFGAMVDWATKLEIRDGAVVYSDPEYRSRFPVRERCRLCRLEPVLWRTGEENFHAGNVKSVEAESQAVSAEIDSHAEGAEPVSHAAFPVLDSHAETAESAEKDAHAEIAEAAEKNTHAEAEEAGVAPEGE